MTEDKDQYPILSTIDSPHDLKRLPGEELPQLASEIRKKIIQTVSKTGGHLAPNLGVVELTIALHYVFKAPRDKIIWDVGHQAYAHKLLTGRRDRFSTLRTYGGISGFPRRDESPYDAFDTGHSSTSISAGLGISTAKALKKENGRVVCVIGDGSTTAGMAFEGLNQAGETEKDLIVVLNDNAMSISPNVGAFSSFLSRRMTGRRFVYFRRELVNFLRSIPEVGDNILSFVRKGMDSFMTFFTPGMLFEAFKFKYFGPIGGHRIDRLIETFQNIQLLQGPILVHVLTVKGKGYPPAEEDPAHYHGVSCFEVSTGSLKSSSPRVPTYTEVFGDTMSDLGRKEEKLFAITAAMPEGTGLKKFADSYPERFLDVGIAEQHAVTFAAGLATEGFKPVVAIYSTFLQRAFDQIIHDVCLPNLHVIFCLDRSGLVGEDGPTHHGCLDITFLRSLPNMTLMAPKDENELRHMLYTALMHQGPVAIRYPRGRGEGATVEPEYRLIPVGKAEIIREGKDIVIIALGSMVSPSVKAAMLLEKEELSVGVVNCRFVKPLDRELVSFARPSGRVLVVEENVRQGGLSSAILELFSDMDALDVHIKRVGLPDKFVEHGPVTILRKKYGLDASGIAKAVREFFR
ncbi:MAG: 1-deoxy-D-xylulose-5-phosphate synthase [Deltaproteobacteria bacterium]|nr:1-deoxy-D-xylulose-5-phosphate synthase [Deltaproteobacteria bacterium]MBW2044545.1 1-deoxy-D-xylulose-5-phosphate synthase [Deltaproteobacteria bacterium]MBW2299106.1 1-deoxy-D-xylulose-5-phosphate synthase [Deltaproteobacteria bacterium]